MKTQVRIKTPHAAVIIWNYVDRIGNDGVTKVNETEKAIISTLSCISIQTTKSKANPQGSFQLVLAPFKNWVSTITAGSWCAILMSNEPITENDLKIANKKQLKMIGKIESVRAEVVVDEDAARHTQFYVSGVDWGHVFNNSLYIDNLLAGPNDPTLQGNGAAVAIRKAMTSDDGLPLSFKIKDNLNSIMGIFGKPLSGFTELERDINRLAKSIYNFIIPTDMVQFLQLGSTKDKKNTEFNRHLKLINGALKTKENKYEEVDDGVGFINPFSLQGNHTFWQILMDNSNPVLNEMIAEMRWDDKPESHKVDFCLYNRIKPFSYKGYKPKQGSSKNLKSYFQLIKMHDLDPVLVRSVNAGTNWRDKFNFIEVKPNFQDFNIFSNWSKQKSQSWDELAFQREGFRPIIMETKQFPTKGATGTRLSVDFDQIPGWINMMREWYFDTHRMLNGTLTMTGTNDYIAVGDNIRFDMGLLNPTPNFNSQTYKTKTNNFILAHVENIAHSFSVTPDGARTYTTIIQFVRGITVNKDNTMVDEGMLDIINDKVPPSGDRNYINTNATSDRLDPDPDKVNGR